MSAIYATSNPNAQEWQATLEARITQLERQMAAQQGALERGNGLSMLVFSGELDKLLAAFTMAAGAAACGMDVKMFFTFWGAAALKKAGAQAANKTMMERMFGWLLPGGSDRLKLSRLDMLGIGRYLMKREMKKKRVPSLPELIDMARESGVQIYICEMSMNIMGVRSEELIDYPGVQCCGAAGFVDMAANSRMSMFI